MCPHRKTRKREVRSDVRLRAERAFVPDVVVLGRRTALFDMGGTTPWLTIATDTTGTGSVIETITDGTVTGVSMGGVTRRGTLRAAGSAATGPVSTAAVPTSAADRASSAAGPMAAAGMSATAGIGSATSATPPAMDP